MFMPIWLLSSAFSLDIALSTYKGRIKIVFFARACTYACVVRALTSVCLCLCCTPPHYSGLILVLYASSLPGIYTRVVRLLTTLCVYSCCVVRLLTTVYYLYICCARHLFRYAYACGGGRKGLRWCGFALFLVRFCGNFHFNSRYCGFKALSGLRLLQPLTRGFRWKKKCLRW